MTTISKLDEKLMTTRERDALRMIAQREKVTFQKGEGARISA
jgi:hypothetical protein